MDLRSHFKRLFAYDAWGNRAELAGISGSERALILLGHILTAQRIWLSRLQGRQTSAAPWDALTAEECAVAVAELEATWPGVLDQLDFDATIEYTNSKGDSFRTVTGDILTHLAMHGAYHRGQIATHLRASGELPPVTDYIHAARMGLLD